MRPREHHRRPHVHSWVWRGKGFVTSRLLDMLRFFDVRRCSACDEIEVTHDSVEEWPVPVRGIAGVRWMAPSDDELKAAKRL